MLTVKISNYKDKDIESLFTALNLLLYDYDRGNVFLTDVVLSDIKSLIDYLYSKQKK